MKYPHLLFTQEYNLLVRSMPVFPSIMVATNNRHRNSSGGSDSAESEADTNCNFCIETADATIKAQFHIGCQYALKSTDGVITDCRARSRNASTQQSSESNGINSFRSDEDSDIRYQATYISSKDIQDNWVLLDIKEVVVEPADLYKLVGTF